MNKLFSFLFVCECFINHDFNCVDKKIILTDEKLSNLFEKKELTFQIGSLAYINT